MLRRLPLAFTLAACLVGASWPAKTAAYCRTTTVEGSGGSCPEPCETRGLPLYWPRRYIRYVLNERGFPDLPGDELRQILESSFGAWQDVACDGEPIDLHIMQEDESTMLGPRAKEEAPYVNVLAHLTPDEWEDDPHALAVTNLRYNSQKGEILGADMFFNGRMDPFGICPETGCAEDELTDLANVVTHEAGHFLGLAHSPDRDATMWCDAAPGDVDKRSLGDDDIRGICAIYGPSAETGSSSLQARSAGGLSCSVSRGQSPGPWTFWLLLSLAGILRRRPGSLGLRR